jgi:23S rRNA (adenine2503-C2)-methyltransferase
MLSHYLLKNTTQYTKNVCTFAPKFLTMLLSELTNPPELTDIRSLSLPDLKERILLMGEKPFRAKQIYEWLWQRGAHDFEAMTNLSKNLRQMLQQHFVIQHLHIAKQQRSSDGTLKLAFELYDQHWVEGVLIPAPWQDRFTACVSSQVGCSLSCRFCATGKLKMERNLRADEIFDQVFLLNQQSQQLYGHDLTNIVYMGMGEPLLNYKNVLQSIERITAPDGLGMSPRRITVSTAGIAKMIKKLADDNTKFNLAISLHAANDLKRNEIMAINETNSLSILAEALRYYFEKLERMVTYEYIVFQNFNDNIEDAKELARFCKIIPSKVNLIEYNSVDGVLYTKSDEDRLLAFQQYLEGQGVTATLRRSRGKDIDAACGQLANKN